LLLNYEQGDIMAGAISHPLPHNAPDHASVGFFDAVKAKWQYALLGGVVGTCLILLASLVEYLSHRWGQGVGEDLFGLIATIVEHIGMGIIVAAVAVVLYEWGAHYKDSMKLSAELKDLKDAVGQFALDGALQAMVHSDIPGHDEEMVRDLKKLITSHQQLLEHGDWARKGYARYLALLLRNATQNAERLCAVSTSKHDDPDAVEYHIEVLSPAVLTDSMLAEQMMRLPNGGRYSIASNVGSWSKGRLERLSTASEDAVRNRGVTIRRIFVLTEREPHFTTFADAREVLGAHLRYAGEWIGGTGAYMVKLLDSEMLNRVPREHRRAAESLFNEHFGIFDRPDRDLCIRVEVNEPDLSDLRIGGVVRGSKAMQRFDAVWKTLPPLDNTELTEALDRLEQSERLRSKR
jgi:hypothetical protein